MKDFYQRYMEASIIHFMAYPETIKGEGPIIETLTKIAEDPFFTAVEIGQIKEVKVLKEAAKLLKQAHMRVGFGAQPILLIGGHNLNSPDENTRNQAIDAVKSGIDQAYELNAERLGLLSGPAPDDPSDREEQVKLLIDSLNQISEYTEDKGDLGITLETFDQTFDKKALIGDSHKEASQVAEAVKREGHNFGIMVDLSHLPMQGETPHQALSAVKDHLVHAHIGNCLIQDKDHPAYGDKHPRFGIDGGENDVSELVEYLKALFEVDFLGGEKKPFVGFEISPMDKESSEIVIANAKRVFNEAWAKLEV